MRFLNVLTVLFFIGTAIEFESCNPAPPADNNVAAAPGVDDSVVDIETLGGGGGGSDNPDDTTTVCQEGDIDDKVAAGTTALLSGEVDTGATPIVVVWPTNGDSWLSGFETNTDPGILFDSVDLTGTFGELGATGGTGDDTDANFLLQNGSDDVFYLEVTGRFSSAVGDYEDAALSADADFIGTVLDGTGDLSTCFEYPITDGTTPSLTNLNGANDHCSDIVASGPPTGTRVWYVTVVDDVSATSGTAARKQVGTCTGGAVCVSLTSESGFNSEVEDVNQEGTFVFVRNGDGTAAAPLTGNQSIYRFTVASPTTAPVRLTDGTQGACTAARLFGDSAASSAGTVLLTACGGDVWGITDPFGTTPGSPILLFDHATVDIDVLVGSPMESDKTGRGFTRVAIPSMTTPTKKSVIATNTPVGLNCNAGGSGTAALSSFSFLWNLGTATSGFSSLLRLVSGYNLGNVRDSHLGKDANGDFIRFVVYDSDPQRVYAYFIGDNIGFPFVAVRTRSDTDTFLGMHVTKDFIYVLASNMKVYRRSNTAKWGTLGKIENEVDDWTLVTTMPMGTKSIVVDDSVAGALDIFYDGDSLIDSNRAFLKQGYTVAGTTFTPVGVPIEKYNSGSSSNTLHVDDLTKVGSRRSLFGRDDNGSIVKPIIADVLDPTKSVGDMSSFAGLSSCPAGTMRELVATTDPAYKKLGGPDPSSGTFTFHATVLAPCGGIDEVWGINTFDRVSTFTSTDPTSHNNFGTTPAGCKINGLEIPEPVTAATKIDCPPFDTP